MINWDIFWNFAEAAPIKKVTIPNSCLSYTRRNVQIEKFCIDDGIVYTADKKRIIYSLSGITDEYHIPDTVEDIDPYAFSHTNRMAIFVPDKVELPKDAFFDLRDFSNFVKNKDILRINYQSVEKMPAYYSEYMKISKVSGADVAYAVVYRSGKGWDAAVNEKVSANNNLVNEAISLFQTLLPGRKEAVFKKAVSFVIQNAQYTSGQVIQDFIDFLKNNKSKSVDLLISDIGIQKALKQSEENTKLKKGNEVTDTATKNDSSSNSIEEIVTSNWKGSKLALELKEIIKIGIKYSDGNGISSSEAVIFVIASYAEQMDDTVKYSSMYKTEYVKTHFDKTADIIAQGLDKEELQKLLEDLVFNNENANRAVIIAFGRFASPEQISKLVTQMNKWKNYTEFGATGRRKIIIARGALMLSDSREAMVALDKTNSLGYYASIRETDETTVRDKTLSNFGFDKCGEKTLDLGGKKVTISLDDNVSLTIIDESSGKAVKSIPKKGADAKLYEKAKAEYAEMKKNIKKVVSGRGKLLFEEFLSGKEYSYKNWSDIYVDNAVLNAVGSLIIWKQDDHYYVIDRKGTAIDANGVPFELNNNSISIAHPLDMNKEDIILWQNYFLSGNLKQPFEQIWEPAYNLKSIKEDRYKGCTIPVLRTIGKEKDGITTWGIGAYSEEYGFSLTDCEIEYSTDTRRIIPRVNNDAKFILGNIKITKHSRYANHMIYLLDKWTIEERIKNDDTSIVDVLYGFTIAQIIDSINVAQEAEAHDVLAKIMDYKYKKYKDYNPMDKYTLDI